MYQFEVINLGMASFLYPQNLRVKWSEQWRYETTSSAILDHTGYIDYQKKHPGGWNDQFSYVKAQVLSIDFIE